MSQPGLRSPRSSAAPRAAGSARLARRAGGLATALAASLLGAALAGCDDPTNLISVQLNLDRPVDVAFTCYGGLRLTGNPDAPTASDEVITSAQPLYSCDQRAKPRDVAKDPAPTLPKGQGVVENGPEVPSASYYGLILQTGPGTVAVSRFPAERAATYTGSDTTILDTDPLSPGKNSISVGTLPVAIGTDPSGCFAVTANAGSCDLSSLDVNSALQFDGQAKVTRFDVVNGAGVKINARPAAMVLSPAARFVENVGQRCPAKPTGLAYVAYPSCQMVAAVDLATGVVQKAITFNAAGDATIVDGAAVTCDTHCVANPATPAGPEPATLDLVLDDDRAKPAGSTTDDTRPITSRLVIGGRRSPKLTLVNLDPATSLSQPLMPLSSVALAPRGTTAVGVLDVALSPQIGMGDGAVHSAGTDNVAGTQYQFAYAVTTDGTVRVASVLPTNLRECDTQIDPRVIHDVQDANELVCIAIGSKPRRPGAQGPGIPVPGDGVASAINIFRVDPPPGDTRIPPLPTRLNGYFGVVTSTTGATFLIDIDDEDRADVENLALDMQGRRALSLAVDLSVTLPHQLRDQVVERNAVAEAVPEGKTEPERLCNSTGPGIDESGALRGGPRIAGPFSRITLPEVLANNKLIMLPNLRQLQCDGSDTTTSGTVSLPELAYGNRPEERESHFPDTQALASLEDWRFVWEGPLSGDSLVQDINGPAVRFGTVKVEGGALKVSDRSKPYCAAGVEAFDQVQLRGCDPNATTTQCPTGTRCYLHPEAALGIGTCIPEKATNGYIEQCRNFMVSVRRYTVNNDPRSGELTLLPRIRELRSTPLDGCADDTQCAILANSEARQATDKHPFEDTAVSTKTYKCEVDATRKGNLKRCMMTCTRNADCDASSSCDTTTGRCMEGPIPPADCIVGLQRYDLRASEAFTLLGSLSGYVHSITADATGKCVAPASTVGLLKVGRLPLNPPPCTADPATSPNPCLKASVDHAETATDYTFDGAQCVEGTAASRMRTPRAIWFRNRGISMNLVDPTYPGDFNCRGDRAGFRNPATPGTPLQIANVPSAFVGLAFTFRQVGGYLPFGLRTSLATVPVKVVRGPQQSIWVVDEGDFISESTTQASTRGKVYRIESSSLGIVNLMQ
jgi:hypothetical protein